MVLLTLYCTWINVQHIFAKKQQRKTEQNDPTGTQLYIFQMRTDLLLDSSEHRQRKFRSVWTCCRNACPSPTIRWVSNKHICITRNWKHPYFSNVWPMQNNASHMPLNGAFDTVGHNKWFMSTCCHEVNVRNNVEVSVLFVFPWFT